MSHHSALSRIKLGYQTDNLFPLILRCPEPARLINCHLATRGYGLHNCQAVVETHRYDPNNTKSQGVISVRARGSPKRSSSFHGCIKSRLKDPYFVPHVVDSAASAVLLLSSLTAQRMRGTALQVVIDAMARARESATICHGIVTPLSQPNGRRICTLIYSEQHIAERSQV